MPKLEVLLLDAESAEAQTRELFRSIEQARLNLQRMGAKSYEAVTVANGRPVSAERADAEG